jgi:hypothetical protein
MSLEQILSGVGDTARRLARVGRMIEAQQKFDSAVAAASDRIQKSKQLEKRIRRVVRATA